MNKFTKGLLVGSAPMLIAAAYLYFGFSSYGGSGSYGPSTLRRHAEGFGLLDVRLDAIPLVRSRCDVYWCYGFTARTSDNKHVFGFVWRNILGMIDIKFCSPDGGWPGSSSGECPYGKDVEIWRKKNNVELGPHDMR